MEEQQQGGFVDVAVGDVLWGAGEHWKNDSKLATRSHKVTAVRPKTILISGAEGSPWRERETRIQRVESNPTTVANGAVGRSAYGGFLYRTEQDAVRAAVRSAEQDVGRAEIRLEAAQSFAASSRQALAGPRPCSWRSRSWRSPRRRRRPRRSASLSTSPRRASPGAPRSR